MREFLGVRGVLGVLGVLGVRGRGTGCGLASLDVLIGGGSVCGSEVLLLVVDDVTMVAASFRVVVRG